MIYDKEDALRLAPAHVGRTIFGLSAWAAVLLLAGCRSDLELAKACYRVGDYDRARTLFEKAIDVDPLSFDARYGLALVLQETSLQKKALDEDKAEDWSEVVNAYQICTHLGGDNSLFAQNYAFALFHLANKLYQEQKYAAASDYLQEARKLQPGDKYTLNLAGVVAFNLGKYQEARDLFQYLLTLDPDFLSAYFNLGNVYWKLHRPDDAVATWRRGLQRSPGEPTLTRRLNEVLPRTVKPAPQPVRHRR